MVGNELQHQRTTDALARFGQALESLQPHLDKGDDNARALRRTHQAALQSEIAVLRGQLAEFDDLRAGRRTAFALDSFDGLGATLIKARPAAGLTDAAFAERLGIAGSEIERHEATEYGEASLHLVCEVAETLGVALRGETKLLTAHARAADSSVRGADRQRTHRAADH
jgi:hypothetical protein